MDILAPLDFRVAEQVIEVPKIVCPLRAARTVICAPQTSEQLVEAPTIVSLVEVVEQPVDIPVRAWGGTGGRLQGFLPGQFSSSSVEQNVDIPVPHGRDRVGGGLLGLHPGQSSTAFGGAEPFPAATAEQIVDIPVLRGGRVLHPASSSSGLPGLANQGFFSHLSSWEKSARSSPHSGSELSADFIPSTLRAQQQSTSPAMNRETRVNGDDVWVRVDTLEIATVGPLAMVPAVVRALTAARIIGWRVWWSSGFGVPLG